MKRPRIYSSSLAAIEAMMAAIRGAQKTIYWESYIFANDNLPTYDFFSLFKEKADASVKVVIILDGLGSYNLSKESLASLKRHGVEVLFFGRWFRRTHRKILIVDEKYAFLGGVNVGKLYMKWLDLHMRISGPIIPALTHSFAKSYGMCGGKDLSVLAERNMKNTLRETKMWLIEHWPIFNSWKLKEYYLQQIDKAEKSIIMLSPYFIPHEWLIRTLARAAKRGVAIEVIFPEKTDPPLADIPNYYYADMLSGLPISFWLMPAMNHGKALLVDGREALIGSHNLDAFSFDFNVEVGVIFNDQKLVKQLSDILTEWKNNSKPFSQIVWRRRWYYPFLSFIVKLFQPVL